MNATASGFVAAGQQLERGRAGAHVWAKNHIVFPIVIRLVAIKLQLFSLPSRQTGVPSMQRLRMGPFQQNLFIAEIAARNMFRWVGQGSTRTPAMSSRIANSTRRYGNVNA
jgi:hypothetical protein